ncbi:hypothetical protein KSP39_PZI001479 [Platanthera zijinensis]
MPVHTPGHWSLLVCDLMRRKWDFYDSMPRSVHRTSLPTLVSAFYKDAHKALPSDLLTWKIEPVDKIPKQQGGTDCGVFVLKYMEAALSPSEIVWENHKNWQASMSRFRAEIAADFFRVFHEIIVANLTG